MEGNGLYDASDPKGKFTFAIFKHQQIDVITSGNHELYLQNTSKREYGEMVPDYKNSYIASNLDIRDSKAKNDEGEWTAMAPRYRILTTKNLKLRVLAFGFVYDFHGTAPNTRVQDVEETIKEQWFQDAIREKNIDLFLIAGHVPVRASKEYDALYKAIRKEIWDTPIVFFGGHTHIRDFKKWESNAMGIESGRYMETLGFLSIDGLGSHSAKGKGDVAVKKSPKYQRLYIDNNLFSLHHHSGTDNSTFPTELGQNVSSMIHDARKNLTLDHIFGCAPHDFWLNRAPFPSEGSILTLLGDKILADTFNARKDPAIIVTNSGAIRFDIFNGPFTIDTTFLVSPFTSGFRMIKNVDTKLAARVISILNNEGPIPLKDLSALAGDSDKFGDYRLHDLMAPSPPVNNPTLNARHAPAQSPLRPSTEDPQVPGYTTTDDLGNSGDDTIHQPIKFYEVPNCIATNIHIDPGDKETAPEKVDLVYNEFIQDWVLLALRYLGVTYGEENTRMELEGRSMTEVISGWVGEHWGCGGDGGGKADKVLGDEEEDEEGDAGVGEATAGFHHDL